MSKKLRICWNLPRMLLNAWVEPQSRSPQPARYARYRRAHPPVHFAQTLRAKIESVQTHNKKLEQVSFVSPALVPCVHANGQRIAERRVELSSLLAELRQLAQDLEIKLDVRANPNCLETIFTCCRSPCLSRIMYLMRTSTASRRKSLSCEHSG